MRATQRRRIRKALSWLLLMPGLALLVGGARELYESIASQRALANRAITAPAPAPQLGNAVARMRIPRLGAELFILEGTDPRTLRRGPGHMKGTALPGMQGNCIIAGHRDTHFRILKDIREGDQILLQTRYGNFRYEVTRTKVVSPRNRKPLMDTEEPVLNLITCYPFYYLGPAPRRFIVQARLDGTPVSTSIATASITNF